MGAVQSDSAHIQACRIDIEKISFLELRSNLTGQEIEEELSHKENYIQTTKNGPEVNLANEHKRLSALIKTRARSKTHYKKKENPYLPEHLPT